jgi:hypothetical protein
LAGAEEGGSVVLGASAAALSRFFFVLGRTALQHLLCIEQLAKGIRAARLAADRAAVEASEKQREAAAAAADTAGKKGRRCVASAAAASADEDIGALLGVGSVAADAKLDALAEAVEAQVRQNQGSQHFSAFHNEYDDCSCTRSCCSGLVVRHICCTFPLRC